MKRLKPQNPDQSDLFRSRLDSKINMNHELVRLSGETHLADGGIAVFEIHSQAVR